MKRNVIYKGIWITAFVLSLAVFTSLVSANEEICNDLRDIEICYGITIFDNEWQYCVRYDLLQDNIINEQDNNKLQDICSVPEEPETCSEGMIEMFREAYAIKDPSADLNNDGLVNLQDVQELAVICYPEEEEEEEEDITPVKPPKTVKKSGSPYSYKYEKDGSITFRGMGTAVQYPNSDMIISWDKNTEGIYCWEWKKQDYCGTFYDAYGYEHVNVKKV